MLYYSVLIILPLELHIPHTSRVLCLPILLLQTFLNMLQDVLELIQQIFVFCELISEMLEDRIISAFEYALNCKDEGFLLIIAEISHHFVNGTGLWIQEITVFTRLVHHLGSIAISDVFWQ